MGNDFFRLENKDYDLPFLNNDPRFTTKNVIILLIGFLISCSAPFLIPFTGTMVIKAIIITGASLTAVLIVFKDNMSNIFRMITLRDILLVIIGVVLMIVLSIISSYIVHALGLHMFGDKAVSGDRILFLIRLAIQLIGEELIKFIPLVIISAYLYKSVGRKTAIIIGVIVAQLMFSIFHIPAYGINALPTLLISIGFASVVLPLMYVKTKNIVVCYLIHIIFDIFGALPFLFGIT